MGINMNELLLHQINKHFGSLENVPDQLTGIIQDINNTYQKFEDETQQLQSSIEKQNPADVALKNEQDLMTALMNNIPDHIYFKDLESRFIRINSAHAQSFGLSDSGQAIGKTDFDFFTDEHARQAYNNEQEIIQTGQSISLEEKETWADRPDTWVATTKIPLHDVTGKIIGVFGISKDITESKRAEDQVKQSEILQRALLENIAVGIMIIDPETCIIEHVNTCACSLIGECKEKIIGRKCNEFICLSPENECKVHILNEEIDNAESVLKRINKPSIAILKTVKRIKIRGEEKLLGSFVDISAQKETEEALQQSSKKLEAIVAASPDGIGIVSLDGKLQFVSDKLAAMYGFTAEEKNILIGQSVFSFTDPSYRDVLKDNIQKLLGIVGNSKITEYLTRRKDGSRFYADSNSTILFDSKGNPESILFIQRDITNRKQAEETLNNERALFRTIIDLIPDAVYVKDADGRKILANPKELQFAGKTSEDEIIGQTDFNLYPDETAKRAFDEDQTVLQTGNPILDIEGELIDRAGILHWLLVSKVPLRNAHGHITGLVGVTRDITEHKRIEAALTQAMQEADLANKAKSEFLANMSHEIRTPLNGVIGFTDLLQKTPLNKIQRQYAENVNSSGLALLGIINDILDFSKIEAGKMELDCIKTDIIELFEQASDIIKYHASKKELELLLNIPNNLPRFAVVDPIRLKQILINLLSNAVKFTHSGEVELKIIFTKKDECTGKFIISVRDTGIGINNEQQQKLFKAFSQADSSTTRKFGGTGLGLIISSMLAEKMGSKIEIISEPGRGSTFFFTIETQFEIGEKHYAGSLENLNRILVVDDNDNNRMILEHNFNNWGIEFVGIDNGLSALNVIEHATKPFDLIIVDYHMPYLNGIDTIRMIREKLKLSPEMQPIVLLHSSSDDFELYEECKKLGVRFNLTKPVKSEELLHYLMNIHNQPVSEVKEWEAIPKPSTIELVNTSPLSILVAEDVTLNMILVTTIITQMLPSVTIFEAKNGKEALDMAIVINPDLILMDVQMPEMSGVESTIEIRNHEKGKNHRIPIIALTAGVIKGEKEKCLEAGMDDFLAKPIEQSALRGVLEKYLNSSPPKSGQKQEINSPNNEEIHFDITKLLDSIGNNNIVLKELIDEIPRQFSGDIAWLEKSIAKKNIEDIKKAAHAIKGVSLGMCFNQMGKIAEEVEMSIENAAFDKLYILFNKMTSEWEQIQSIIKNLKL